MRPGRPRRLATLLLGGALTAAHCPGAGPGPPAATWGPDSPPGELHALLLNGGGARRINYFSHLEHLRKLLGVLAGAGVAPARITVFSADGADPATDLATLDAPPDPSLWLLPRKLAERLRRPIRYVDSAIEGFALRPATRPALRRWFEREGRRLEPGDTLLLYVTDHGTKNEDDLRDNRISLWGQSLAVGELRVLLARLDPGVRVVLWMSQCFSGSFANAMWPDADPGGLPPGNVCGYFSVPPDRRATGCYPETFLAGGVGHSDRMLEALATAPRLPAAHRSVLVTDRSPDVPNTTSDFFLKERVERRADAEGRAASARIDELLEAALADPRPWQDELAVLDRLGRSFGFASSRSIREQASEEIQLRRLARQLDTWAERWEAALEDLRRANLRRFAAAHPIWEEKIATRSVRELIPSLRALEREALLGALVPFTRASAETDARLEDLHRRAREAREAGYRAEVRLAALLRMRVLLTRIAGRHQLAHEGTAAERDALARLEACEDLAFGQAAEASPASGPEPPQPFPSLAEERPVLEGLVPAWLGIAYGPVEAARREREGLPPGAALVRGVTLGSPAEEAGLREADVVLGPPGADFQEPGSVREWTLRGEVGAPQPLRVRRDGEELAVLVRLRAPSLKLPRLGERPRLGDPAPPTALELVRGGPPAPGSPQLLFFWSAWCETCREALPALRALERERGVPVVAITEDGAETVERLLAGAVEPLPGRIALDPRRAAHRGFGVSGLPTFVWVDADGRVAGYQVGYEAGSRLPGPGEPGPGEPRP